MRLNFNCDRPHGSAEVTRIITMMMTMKNNNCYLFLVCITHRQQVEETKEASWRCKPCLSTINLPHREDDLGGRRSSTFTHKPAQRHRGRSQGDLPRPLDRVVSVEGSREDQVQTAVAVECFVFLFLLKDNHI